MNKEIFYLISEINFIKFKIKDFKESMVYCIIRKMDEQIEQCLIKKDINKLYQIRNQLYRLSQLLLSYNLNHKVIKEQWESELKRIKEYNYL